jgi:UDP-N-acetylmuramoylalanine--D-glutamate ligase
VDKGGDFGRLRDPLRRGGRGLILMGGSRDALRAALGGVLPTREVATMRAAVQAAREMAVAGDAVLLAPGCASFDLYANYQERGEDFRRAVLDLKETPDPPSTASPTGDADEAR